MTKSVLHEVVETAPDLMPSTRDRYLRDLNAWIDFVGDDPRHWTSANAQAYYNALLNRGLKPQSANRAFASVAYASRWWAHNLGSPDLDFGRVRTAKSAGKIPKRSLSEEQAAALIKACVGPTPIDLRDFAMCVVGLDTGMRRMSIASMATDHTFTRADKTYPHTNVYIKGKNDRVRVPLSDTAIRALEPWLNWIRGKKGKSSSIFRSLTKRIGPDRNVYTLGDRSLCGSAIAKIIDGRAKDAGIDHVNPHMFRHTFITWRASHGFHPHEIAAMTGHSLSGLGALGGYMDMHAIGERIRNSTPRWLVELVNSVVS